MHAAQRHGVPEPEEGADRLAEAREIEGAAVDR